MPTELHDNAPPPQSPDLLQQANRLYSSGETLRAACLYCNYVEAFKRGKFDRLPFFVAVRAKQQAFVVRVSSEFKLAYFPIPKAACTSISHVLYELIHGSPFAGCSVHKAFDAGSAELELNHYMDHFKFTVVRDPIERFVSGYRNRILHHADLESGGAGINGTAVPDINTFALNLERYRVANMRVDNHFQLQKFRLSGDLAVFDKIYRFEQLPQLQTELSERTKRPLRLGNHQSEGPIVNVSYLSQNAFNALLEFYAEDYQLLQEFYSIGRIREKYEKARTRSDHAV